MEVQIENIGVRAHGHCFWDCEQILFIKYILKNTIMNEDYYAAHLIKVRQMYVEKKREQTGERSSLFARQCAG